MFRPIVIMLTCMMRALYPTCARPELTAQDDPNQKQNHGYLSEKYHRFQLRSQVSCQSTLNFEVRLVSASIEQRVLAIGVVSDTWEFMPIIRSEDQPDKLSQHLLYLWSRRWSLILPALLVAVGAFGITYYLKEEYAATAQLFVNKFAANDDDGLLPNPATVAKLLENDLLFNKVREDFLQKFGGQAKDYPIEKFGKQFSVKSSVLQDTSVKKDVSPILLLSVQSAGKEQTLFLMESWLKNFIQMFGNYSTVEHVQKRDALRQQNSELEKDLSAAEAELALVDATKPLDQKMLAGLMNLLAPAHINEQRRTIVPFSTTGDTVAGSNTDVQLNASQSNQTGLIDRQLALKLEAAMAASGIQTTRTVEQIRKEHDIVSATIADIQTSITSLQKQVAVAEARGNTLQRQIQMLMTHQTRLRGRLSNFEIGAAVYGDLGTDTTGTMLSAADVRVLSGPVAPQLKIWPRRTLTALAAGAFTFVLIAVMVLLLNGIRRATA